MRILHFVSLMAAAGLLLVLPQGPGNAQEPDAAQQLERARAQVVQALKLADSTRAGVFEYFYDHREWPGSIDEVRGPGPVSGPNVESIEVIRGSILIRFAADAADGVAGRQIALRPTVAPNVTVYWTCGHAQPKGGTDPDSGPAEHLATDVDDDLLPEHCR